MIAKELIENIQISINKIKEEKYILFIPMLKEGLPLEPTFYYEKNDGNISPVQDEVFGIYMIRNIYRGCLLSINHILGGQILLEKKLFAPSLTSIYAGSFHLLNSLLAKKGKVIEPLIYVENKKIIESKSFQVNASFSKKNKTWHFNKMALDHKKKWRLINDLFRTNKYPAYFNPLFKYWFGNEHKGTLTLHEYANKVINGEEIERYTFNEKINEFLDYFIGFRHMASYKSFGGDIFFYNYIINAKPYDLLPDMMDNHCRMYLKFAENLLLDVIDTINFLTNNLEIDEKYKQFLWRSINQPAFDTPAINMFNKETETNLREILKWFDLSS